MDWKQIIIWFGQWLLIEIGKRNPKIGNWVQANAAAILPILTTIVTVLGKIIGVPQAAAGVAQPVPVGDPLAEVFFVNYIGTLAVDNIVRKLLWHFLLGKVFRLNAAKKPASRT